MSVIKLQPDLSGTLYTCNPVSFVPGLTRLFDLALDSAGNAWGAGYGNNGPSSDALVIKVDTSGEVTYSRYLGGSQVDAGRGLAAENSSGRTSIYVTGYTFSSDLPTTAGVVQLTANGYGQGFIAKIQEPIAALPLIFVPGIGGSFLKEPDATFRVERWPGLLTNHDHLTLDPDLPPYNIIATDAIRRFLAFDLYGPMLERLVQDGGFREYQLSDDHPEWLTENGCNDSQYANDPNKPNLFVFPYDWRKSNNENAGKLKSYVKCVQKFYPNSKVDILAHSMGGLLSRRYILQNPGEHNVRKLISVNTPWLGAPKGISVLETGDFVIFVTDRTIKRLAEFFQGAHQLLPSRNYYEVSQHYDYLPVTKPFIEEGWDINLNGIAYETYEYEQQVELLDSLHPRSLSGTQENSFNESAFVGGNEQGDWRFDSTGVEYHHIATLKRRLDTIGAVRATRSETCSLTFEPFTPPTPILRCQLVDAFKTTFTRGDGTVPIISLRRGWGKALNLNKPDARLWFNNSSDENEDGKFEHTGALQDRENQDLVLYLLGRRQTRPDFPPVTPGPLSRREQPPAPDKQLVRTTLRKQRNMRGNHGSKNRVPTMPQTTQEAFGDEVPSPQPSYYLSVTGVDYVSVTDAQGNTNTRLDDLLIQPVPNVTYLPTGDHSVLISAGTTNAYTMTFQVGAQPLAIELLKGESNADPTLAIRYTDLVLPSGVQAQIVLTPQGVENLRYDANGDGLFETEVMPTVNVTGAAARDVTAPIVTAGATIQGTQTQVTLAATDTEAGVKAIYYSTDGTAFRPYTAPLTLDPAQTQALYAFADDNVLNRSGLLTSAVPLGISGHIVNAQGAPARSVTVTLSWTANNANETLTTQTDSDGKYSFSNLMRGVSYTVTPSEPNATFAPATQTANNLNGNQVFNFTANAVQPNRPPYVSEAQPSIASLWPSNHSLIAVSVLGVTDPDGDAISITINQVKQDEPTNGTGDGDTCPDAAGLGTATA